MKLVSKMNVKGAKFSSSNTVTDFSKHFDCFLVATKYGFQLLENSVKKLQKVFPQLEKLN